MLDGAEQTAGFVKRLDGKIARLVILAGLRGTRSALRDDEACDLLGGLAFGGPALDLIREALEVEVRRQSTDGIEQGH